jgi:uncharacterized metal-binding protein
MRECLGRQFVAELLAELPDAAARRAAERVLRRWAGVRLSVPHPEPEARSTAVLMAAAGIPRATIVARLTRAGVPDRTAHRWVARAVAEVQHRAP